MYNEVVAKSASRFEKMRKSIVLELNQDTEVLFCLKAFHLFLSYPPNPKRTSIILQEPRAGEREFTKMELK